MPKTVSTVGLLRSTTRVATHQAPAWVQCSGFLLSVFVSLCVFAVVTQYAAVEYGFIASMLVYALVWVQCKRHNGANLAAIGWQGMQWQLLVKPQPHMVFCTGSLQRVWRTPWWIVVSFSLSQHAVKYKRYRFTVWRSTVNPALWRALNTRLNRDVMLQQQTITAKDAT